MTAAQITGGTVKFIEPSNYQAGKRGAEVTLTFSVADGAAPGIADTMLEHVARMAIAKALEIVNPNAVPQPPIVDYTGQPTSAGTVALARIAPVPPTQQPALVAPSTAASATTLPAASTPPALVGNTDPAPPTAAAPALVALTPPSTSPALIGAGSLVPESFQAGAVDPTLIGATAAPGAASPALISTVAASAPAEITDADLVNAITAANARMFARAQTEEEKLLVPRNLGAALLAHLPKEFHGQPKVQQVAAHLRPAALAAFNAL